MVAGAATFVVALLFWIISWFADSAGPTIGVDPDVPVDHAALRRLRQGRHRHEHLVFYLSFIAFGLFLTLKSVDSERWRG